MAGIPAVLVVAIALTAALRDAPAVDPTAVRVGITPVLVEDHLERNRELVAYLGEKLGRATALVQRRSYKELSELLQRRDVDVAFVCGLPYVVDHDRFGLELLAAPLVHDEPVYYSYLIVPADSPARRLEDLRGKLFAFADPLSNSGWLIPTYELARNGTTPESFFRRAIFTYSHSGSVEAVAIKLVDGASVDSYVFERLARTRPDLAGRTRVIARVSSAGIPPVVIRTGLDPRLKEQLRAVLLGMDEDPRGRAILGRLDIKRFVDVADERFDGIREMHRFVGERAAAASRRAAR
jgi:phosphonate transport system substrate-binding protein